MSERERQTTRALFAERLKELRAEKGTTQISLSQSIGVSKGLISLWENGLREPTLSNLVALADHFDVALDYLAGRTKD